MHTGSFSTRLRTAGGKDQAFLCVVDRSQLTLEVWGPFADLRLFHNLELEVWAKDELRKCRQGLVSNSQFQVHHLPNENLHFHKIPS